MSKSPPATTRALLTAAALLLVAPSLPAQQHAPVALTRSSPMARPDTSALRAPRPPLSAVAARTGGGVLLGLVTAFGGYLAWYAVEEQRQCRGQPRGFCGIDTDPLAPVAIVAAIPGMALGASAPRMGSPCRFGQRFTRALTGAAVGTALGAALTIAGEAESQLLAAPGAGVIGAVWQVGNCR